VTEDYFKRFLDSGATGQAAFVGGHSIDYSQHGKNWGGICATGKMQSPVHVPVYNPNLPPPPTFYINISVAMHFGDTNNAKLDVSDNWVQVHFQAPSSYLTIAGTYPNGTTINNAYKADGLL
jgi:hypothetical protein